MLQLGLGLRKAVNGRYRALFNSIVCRKLQCKRKAKNFPEEPVITQKLESKMSQTQSEIPDSSTGKLLSATQNTSTGSILYKIAESYRDVFLYKASPMADSNRI